MACHCPLNEPFICRVAEFQPYIYKHKFVDGYSSVKISLRGLCLKSLLHIAKWLFNGPGKTGKKQKKFTVFGQLQKAKSACRSIPSAVSTLPCVTLHFYKSLWRVARLASFVQSLKRRINAKYTRLKTPSILGLI